MGHATYIIPNGADLKTCCEVMNRAVAEKVEMEKRAKVKTWTAQRDDSAIEIHLEQI